MKTIPFSKILDREFREDVLQTIRLEGTLIYPTDTLYGLGGDFLSARVHGRIDAIKGRSDLPYSAAIGSLEMLKPLVGRIPDIFTQKLAQLLPGPYTFIFQAAVTLSSSLLKGKGTIGIRIPSLPPLLSLISASGVPWITTSVNLSGKPPIADPEEIDRPFNSVDLLIDAGRVPVAEPSTVVDLTVTPPRIVRPGAGLERLRAAMRARG